ncbi:MAG: indolepyruvate ferredoxin oxidoreductase subunit alpha [bacterium]|nr:indolepyruvate ferredoxin oxidoreductase subunit alpha [bacterium]
MKVLLSGNEAVARGCHESGLHVATAYPGTPSTEILEEIASRYAEIDSEWCPNEKVAFEVAMGASFAGARALTAMKHVGLNVAADPFMSVSLIGAPGGLVVVSADDPGMHSSQNEQDNRLYARFAGYPCLEPSDSQESKDFVGHSLEISAAFDVPVMLRMTTRVCHAQSVVRLGERREHPVRGFQPDPRKYVVLPNHARVQHVWAAERLERLAAFSESSPLNREEPGRRDVGVITAGISYQYVRETLPEASIFKLGISHPLPIERIRRFAASVGRLFVVEELEPFIEEQILAAGIPCEGKKWWPRLGEFSPDIVAAGFVRAGVLERGPEPPAPVEVQPRPPVFCPGCPHRGLFVALKKFKALVATDIGCYTLSVYPPIAVGDICVEMGASIGTAVGVAKARGSGKGIVATIGDSTFLHSGMTGLLNAVHDGAGITVVLLDNSITAMTGGQHQPGTGKTLSGAAARPVELAKICAALGVERIRVIDPYDLDQTGKALGEALESGELSVLITNRPCTLYPPEIRKSILRPPFRVKPDACIGCHACFKVGCPAIGESEKRTEKGLSQSRIDRTLCTGCSVCSQVCPVQAIVREPEGGAK